MNAVEIENALQTFEIVIDTREQPTASLKKRITQMAVPIRREKLEFGDYSAVCTVGDKLYSLTGKVAVERKMSLDELCSCYCTGRKRFTKEFERAKQAGAKMYLLIENADFEKAYAGNYRSQMKPKALIASITAWLARYNCQIVFCTASRSGILIREILYRELKESLESSNLIDG